MSRFRFRLQRLLDLRQLKENEAAVAVANARAKAEEATARERELERRRDETRQEMLPEAGQTVRVGELQEVVYLVRALEDRVKDAHKVSEIAERSVQEKVTELGEAMRDRRILDRLRERQVEEWRHEEARQERDVMDAIARDRSGEKKKKPEESADQ